MRYNDARDVARQQAIEDARAVALANHWGRPAVVLCYGPGVYEVRLYRTGDEHSPNALYIVHADGRIEDLEAERG